MSCSALTAEVATLKEQIALILGRLEIVEKNMPPARVNICIAGCGERGANGEYDRSEESMELTGQPCYFKRDAPHIVAKYLPSEERWVVTGVEDPLENSEQCALRVRAGALVPINKITELWEWNCDGDWETSSSTRVALCE